jgi:hypothetical protein
MDSRKIKNNDYDLVLDIKKCRWTVLRFLKAVKKIKPEIPGDDFRSLATFDTINAMRPRCV